MSFDLETHLKHHAFIFKKLSLIDKNSIHFNFSFLDLQFLGMDVEKTMSKLLDALLLPASYNVANGKRKDKHGNVVQKFTTRKIDLQKDVQALAIHLKGPEGEDTMPHIHFIANGSARFGNGYSLLKKHVSVVSEQFGLLPNFDEIAEHNPLSVKSLSRAVSQITWSWKKSTNSQLKSEISSRGLTQSISLLESYTLKTKSLTYYIKSMEGLKTRLNRMHLDVLYSGHHLRNTYPIPLTHEDMAVIKLLQNKTFTQKAIKPYLKNPIFRDFIRHSADTTKPFIYDAIKEQTCLLDGVSKNKQAVTNYKKLMKKETPLRKSQLTPSDNQKLLRKNELRRIIMEVSQSATDEKIFRFLMQAAGYSDFGLKKKQSKVVGCIYTELGSKRNVSFTDLGLHWAELKKSFMLNIRQIDNAKSLPSPTLKKEPTTPLERATSKKRTPKPDTISIKYKTREISDKKTKLKQNSKQRRIYEKLIPAIEAKIRKFENFISKLREGISNFKNKIYRSGRRIAKLAGFKATQSDKSGEIKQLKDEISIIEKELSILTNRYRSEGKVEYEIEATSDALKKSIRQSERRQSALGNGDYEFDMHNRLIEEIEREKNHHKELGGKISSIEKELARKPAPTDDDSFLGMGM